MKNSTFRFSLLLTIKTLTFALLFLILNTSTRAAGVLDTTFGTNGRAVTVVGTSAQAKAAAIQPDGKIIVVGDAVRTGTNRDTVLVRYNSNGTPDASFGDGGKVYAAISPQYEEANAVALQPDGKIIVAGSFFSPQTGSNDFLFVRFTADGGLDTTFGNNGVAAVNQGSVDTINAIAVQPDGKIVGVGKTTDGDRAAAIRLNSNGSLDTTFNGGSFFLELSGFSQESFRNVILLPDGRILAGGTGSVSVPHSGTSNFLVSFNPNGSLSSDFGTNGIVVFWAGFALSGGFDFTILPDGKILVLADTMYRFFSDGTRDTTFSVSATGSQLAVRPDGKFLIYGGFFSNFETRFYESNGKLIGAAKNLPTAEIVAQPDGKLVFVGSTETEFTVARLNTITSQATRIADYDSDDKTDIAVLRHSNSTLYVSRSRDGFVAYNSGEASFEVRRVIPERFSNQLPFVYWRTGGNIIGSPASFCATNGAGNRQCTQWGMSGDIPVGGDFDGDTFNDYTVYRPQNGIWYIRRRSNNQTSAVQWGIEGDKPVPADYDYDGTTDIAVYRPSTGVWWIRRSSDGSTLGVQFGAPTDIPLTGDYDGDGRADFVVFRPSNGVWYQLLTNGGFKAVQFGLSTDKPVPGDYDGDGRHDFAVFRQGIWYLLQSTEGFKAVQFGNADDTPVSVRYDE